MDESLNGPPWPAKYAASEDDLGEWGRTSLPVVIEFPADAEDPDSRGTDQAASS